MTTPRLARRDVGHMDFQHGEGHGLDRIVQWHAMLRQAGRVDQRATGGVDVLVQKVDQNPFVVGLDGFHRHPEFGRKCSQPGIDFRERCRAVD